MGTLRTGQQAWGHSSLCTGIFQLFTLVPVWQEFFFPSATAEGLGELAPNSMS
jgi:hypothetical protein